MTARSIVRSVVRGVVRSPVQAEAGGGGGFVGPLDEYSASLAAAYSLRRLLSSYEGSAIRVRESGADAEADIGFTADGEFDTTALLAHCGSNSGYVTKWYDQSGAGLDATQSTGANQPRIVNSGAVDTENTKPALVAGGSSRLVCAAGLNAALTDDAFCALTVCRQTGGATTNCAWGATLSAGFFVFYPNGPSGGASVYYGGASLFAEGVANATQRIHLFDRALTQVSIYANGSSLDTPTTSDDFTFSGMDICDGRGLSQGLTGTIQEVVFFNASQAASLAALSGVANDFYAVY